MKKSILIIMITFLLLTLAWLSVMFGFKLIVCFTLMAIVYVGLSILIMALLSPVKEESTEC